jgi:hypothetical protein
LHHYQPKPIKQDTRLRFWVSINFYVYQAVQRLLRAHLDPAVIKIKYLHIVTVGLESYVGLPAP